MAACLADNKLAGPAFGLIWDGTGLGADGTVWGGECLVGSLRGYARVGSVRPVALLGGDAAARQIGRLALALLLDAGLPPDAAPLPADQRAALAALWRSGLRSTPASSIGRLFDGVYALLTGVETVSYEGEGAERLEALARPDIPGRRYPVEFYEQDGVRCLDTRPLVRAIAADCAAGVSRAAIARGFLDALVAAARSQCRALNAQCLPVVLSGGVFLDRYLLEAVTAALTADGFTVYTHRRVSPSDEGLPLGQLAIAAAAEEREGENEE